MTYVMDACALLAFLRGEQGAEEVMRLLRDETCCMHAANLCEVFYGYGREHGEAAGYEALEILKNVGLILSDDSDLAAWMQAGVHKVRLGRISLADCLCVVLAQRVNGEIVTADHHEFEQVRESGLARVRFIR